jgi:hypothetical protein
MRLPRLVLPLFALGCAPAGGDTGAPWGPVTVDTDGGHFRLDLSLEPDPPVVGESLLVVDTVDAEGAAVSATLTLAQWMPAHGHGAADDPSFRELGDGGVSADLTWSMPGSWELQLEVSHDGTVDQVVVPVEVQ